MKKKLLLLIPLLLLLALVVLVIYWNPVTTPISVQLDMYKIDRNCNEKGMFPLTLTGEWIKPLFEDERLELTFSEFDGLSRLSLSYDNETFPGSVPKPLPGLTLQECYGYAFNSADNQTEFCSVVFSPDLERWMLAFDKVYYVGSTNSEDTLEVLYDYFMPRIIGSWAGDPSEQDLWQYFGTWVTPEGNSKGTVDLKLKFEVEKNEEAVEVLDLYFNAPKDFLYKFNDDDLYATSGDGLLPYFTSTGYTSKAETGEQVLFHLAYDKEKNWSVFVWEDRPDRYLIVAGKPQFDTQEITAHFKDFFDIFI